MEVKIGYVFKLGNLYFKEFDAYKNDNLFVVTDKFDLALKITEKEEAISIANEIGAEK